MVFMQYDFPSILLGCLAALSCGLLGNFLLLRRQALVGDAISHVVLPGIVGAFLLTGTTATWPVMIGATLASLLAVALIELIKNVGRIENGAAMGVIFTTMFAVGVVLLEQSDTSNVHLDVEHTLYGNVESAIWLSLKKPSDLLNSTILLEMPEDIMRLMVVTLLVIFLIVIFFKELRVFCFDPAFANSMGISPSILNFGLITITAIAAVAAFDAVGSILVIAMFICPPATARMLTDNLATQVLLSGIIAILSGIVGYLLAAFGPLLFGIDNSVSAAGMIALTAVFFQMNAMLFAPRYGIFACARSDDENEERKISPLL